MAKFCSLFSGSSGNCTYFESGGTQILIDAGVSLRSVTKALKDIGSDIGQISAIFVTHEHSDHIKGLPMLISKKQIPVYANAGTLEGIVNAYKEIETGCFRELATGCAVEIGSLCVVSFETSHDSRESVGYRIFTSGGPSAAVATDLGVVGESVMDGIKSCKIVMLESNHDVGMLQNGRYPYYLKRRILSSRGHLSNDDCSCVLPGLVRDGTRHFVLAHLSAENNFPELAVQTAVSQLAVNGITEGYTVEAAPRKGPGKIYEF